MAIERKDLPIIEFLGLTLAISSLFYAPILMSGHVGGGAGHYVGGLMWSPALAAFLTAWRHRLSREALGLGWGGNRFALLAYLLPIGYGLLAYGLVWSLGLGGFPNPAAISALTRKLGWESIQSPLLFVPLYFLFIGTTAMITSLAHALGEEIGWRGFLAPRLAERVGFTGGALITGVIWTAWHLPILLFADYNAGTPWWWGMPCFAVMVIGLSVILTWLRLKSASVWPCAILHASHNLFIQGFFTPLTEARGNATAYAIDEFGWALPAVILLFAAACWRRR